MIYEKVTPENIENMKRFAKDNNVTFVFECVDMKHDPHIIEYPESNLYLLDIVYNQINYAKYDYDAMCDTAHRFGLTPRRRLASLQPGRSSMTGIMISLRMITSITAES